MHPTEMQIFRPKMERYAWGGCARLELGSTLSLFALLDTMNAIDCRFEPAIDFSPQMHV
jgi:hypothetical protein